MKKTVEQALFKLTSGLVNLEGLDISPTKQEGRFFLKLFKELNGNILVQAKEDPLKFKILLLDSPARLLLMTSH